MYILGISCYYHDASAALIKNGVVIVAIEEERLTRKKHDTSFPEKAIQFCLEYAGITINEVSYIGFYEKPILKFERVLSQHLETFPKSLKTFINSMPSWINEKLRVMRPIRKRLGYKRDVLFIEHHLAHAASAYLPSPFESTAIVTVDGVGEWTTTTYGRASGNNIELIKEIRFPSSIGLLYSTITAYLGFSVNNSEYKIMGLSAYGDTNRKTNEFYKKLQKVIDIKPDGSFALNMDYFIFHHADRMPSKKLCRLLEGPVEKPDTEMTKRHKDIAAATQMITEDVLTAILKHVHKKTGEENIVLAGGVALNSVYNGKILKSTPFKNIWIQPNASDGGTSIGVSLYIYNTLLDNKRNYKMQSAYLGPEYSRAEVQRFLDDNNIKYSEFKNDEELVGKTAELIRNKNVVGWFQNRMEWGPRALGARSILADPTNKDAQSLLNTKVKHREKFRPFAPVVCVDEALEYFDADNPLPESTNFMLMVYPIKERWQDKIPAVTHVDGSGRLQTIERHQNPLYYDLIKDFAKLSNIPILINTSFNIRGEPIVCTPNDAYRCMMGTEIDYLVMDRFLIKRDDNQKHKWDSEKYAKD